MADRKTRADAELEKAKRGRSRVKKKKKEGLTVEHSEEVIREGTLLSASEANTARLALAKLGKGRREATSEAESRRSLRRERTLFELLNLDGGGC